jgi:hypothetical protein
VDFPLDEHVECHELNINHTCCQTLDEMNGYAKSMYIHMT